MTIKLRKPPMKKLPHEKLRDIDPYTGCVMIGGDEVVGLTQKEGDIIADEIEKYYIPRPRYEDGEPCNIGDEVEFSEPAGVKKVLSFIAGEDGITFANVGLSSGPVAIYAGKVKRPKPKVLDADGVKINPPCKAWDKNNFEEYTVERVGIGGFVYVERAGYRHSRRASTLTQREPDSLEKLRDDMLDLCGTDGEDSSLICDELADCAARLTAIIERGA